MTLSQNKEEKEREVIELDLNGYKQRQIANEFGMSTRDVCKFRNNYKEKMKLTREVSNTSKAFKMYSDGRVPTDVVIELDISPSDAEKMYSDYLRLSNRNYVNIFYDGLKDLVPEFLSFYKTLKKYDGDENTKNNIKRTIDLNYIISKQQQKKHETDLEIEQELEHKFRLEQEIQMIEEQLEKVRKRITNQW